LFNLCGLLLCRFETQTQELLKWQHDTLEVMNRTAINDMALPRLLRAAQSTRLDSIELSGTNIGAFFDTFEQTAKLLEAARRVPSKPITFFGLSSTGLGENHFRRIIRAVDTLPRIPAPGGRPAEDGTCSEMVLELQNVSGRIWVRAAMDYGSVAWDRDDTANIDLVADEHQARDPGRPQSCL
jgi:sugar phosphate isomerase/epimerase